MSHQTITEETPVLKRKTLFLIAALLLFCSLPYIFDYFGWKLPWAEEQKIENKKGLPPWEQPDYKIEEPELTHYTKNFKSVPEWMLKIQEDGKFVYKLNEPPSNPGEYFDENEHWSEELQRLVEYVETARKSGKIITEPNIWMQISPSILTTIVSLASMLDLSAHKYLMQALGENYTIYVVIIEEPIMRVNATFFWFLPKENSWAHQLEGFRTAVERSGSRLIGCIRIHSSGERLTATNYHFDHGVEPWFQFDNVGRLLGTHLFADNPPPPPPPSPIEN